MEFNPDLHHKVKYHGQLYVVILEEFPEYRTAGRDYAVVVHPICNDWIVHITNPDVRKGLTVRKGDGEAVDQTTTR